jgi:membrane protein
MDYGPFSLGGLSVRELATRVWSAMYADAAWDTAAELGYYFMLAIFPLVLFVINILTILQALEIIDPMLLTLGRLMPPQAFALVRDELERVTSETRGDLLTLGAVATVWASSSGVEALLNVLNRAYDVRETRSYFKVRAMSIAMTFVIGLMFVAGGALLAFGDRLSASVGSAGPAVNFVLGVVLLILGLEVIYYYGPNVANQKWRWVSPGSLVAVLLFVLASSGFSAYLRYSDSFSVMYGSIGGVIVMLFWLYILGLALITGGEINAQIAAAARARGEGDAPMVGVEAEPPAEPAADRAPDDPVRYLVAMLDDEHPAVRAAAAAALDAISADRGSDRVG